MIVAAIITALGGLAGGTAAVIAAVRAGKVQRAVGKPNGKGPANQMLEDILARLEDIQLHQTVQTLRHNRLQTRFEQHIAVHPVGGE